MNSPVHSCSQRDRARAHLLSSTALASIDKALDLWRQNLDRPLQDAGFTEPCYGFEIRRPETPSKSSSCSTPAIFNPMHPQEYWKAMAQRTEEEIKYLETGISGALVDHKYWENKYRLLWEILEELRGQTGELRPSTAAGCRNRILETPSAARPSGHVRPLKRSLETVSGLEDVVQHKKTKQIYFRSAQKTGAAGPSECNESRMSSTSITQGDHDHVWFVANSSKSTHSSPGELGREEIQKPCEDRRWIVRPICPNGCLTPW